MNLLIQGEFNKRISLIFKANLGQINTEPDCTALGALQVTLRQISNLLFNHHLFSRWHEENDDSNQEFFQRETYPVSRKLLSVDELDTAKTFFTEIKLDLLRNRKYLWEKV
jgi:hypothetical protein